MLSFSNAERQVYAALERLKAPEMAPLLQFLNNLAEESKTSLIRAEGVTLHRLQGKAGFIEELLDAVQSATSVLEKLR